MTQTPEERALSVLIGWGSGSLDSLVRAVAAAIRAAVAAERERVARPLWQAWMELNAIAARDGAPQHIDWHAGRPIQTAGCDPDYFRKVVDDCADALRHVTGDEPKPWPPAIREAPPPQEGT